MIHMECGEISMNGISMIDDRSVDCLFRTREAKRSDRNFRRSSWRRRGDFETQTSGEDITSTKKCVKGSDGISRHTVHLKWIGADRGGISIAIALNSQRA